MNRVGMVGHRERGTSKRAKRAGQRLFMGEALEARVLLAALADYYLVRMGAWWTYTVTEGSQSEVATTRIDDTQTLDGDTAYAFHVVPSGNDPLDLVDRQWFSLGSDGLKLHKQEPPDAPIWADMHGIVLIGSDLSAGVRHSFSGPMEVHAEFEATWWTYSGTVSGSSTVVGVESVTVPGGTFQAYRVTVNMSFDVDLGQPPPIAGLPRTIHGTQNDTHWLAQGIGDVKLVQRYTISGDTTTDTYDLQSSNLLDHQPPAAAWIYTNVWVQSITIRYGDNNTVQAGSIQPANIKILRQSDGLEIPVSTASSGSGDAALVEALYTVAPPGGTWDSSDNGVYIVYLQPDQVRDFAGNTAAGGALAAFTVDFPSPPVLAAVSCPNITRSGGVTQTLRLRYESQTPIDVATIDIGDIGVVSDTGAALDIHSATVDFGTNGSPRNGVYVVVAPGGTWDPSDNGTYYVTVRGGQIKNTGNVGIAETTQTAFVVAITPDPLIRSALNAAVVITGPDAGAMANVRAFVAGDPGPMQSVYAYDWGFEGGVRVAMGDLTGDGTPETIAGTGVGAAHVKVLDGVTGEPIAGPLGSFLVYPGPGNTPEDPNSDYYRLQFRGGVFVASGDVDGDGRDDLITGADAGAGPHVKVFSGATGQAIRSFFAFDQAFGGGVRVGATDLDGDGYEDILVGTGRGASHVKVFSGRTGTELRSYLVYPGPGNAAQDPTSDYYRLQFRGGVFVAGGDVNGDGFGDIVTGSDAGAGPHVKAISGQTGATLWSIFAYNQLFLGGVRVACADLNGDGRDDVIVGSGVGASHVEAFNLHENYLTPFESLIAYDDFAGGVYVAGAC